MSQNWCNILVFCDALCTIMEKYGKYKRIKLELVFEFGRLGGTAEQLYFTRLGVLRVVFVLLLRGFA